MLYGLGISHETAPLSARECVVISEENLKKNLIEIFDFPEVTGIVLLSTCNRTEIYCALKEPKFDQLKNWLHSSHNLTKDALAPYLYHLKGIDLVHHVMRVSAGLNSLILGEPQILGQMKKAHQTAQQAGTIDAQLEKMFQSAFRAAKSIRSETEIGAHSVSIAYAATQLSQKIFNDLSSCTALLSGAGETIELVATHLKQQNIGSMMFANRSIENAQKLAERFDGYAITLDKIPLHAYKADVIISSTSSPIPIFSHKMIESALKKRNHSPIFLADLAVPRDVESSVSALADAYLYTVDDLKDIIQENLEQRKKAAREAEKIIEQHGGEFMQWINEKSVVPSLLKIRTLADDSKTALLEQAKRQLKNGRSTDEVMEQLANQLTNKLLHPPTIALKKACETNDIDLVETIEKIYLNDKKFKKDIEDGTI